MKDYPRSVEYLDARFSSEMTCREYVVQLHGQTGFDVPARV